MNILAELRRFCTLALLLGSLGLAYISQSAAAAPIHVAFGDVPRIDLLNVLAALERARARGVEIRVSYLQSEDIAAQAVVTGQADIGVGTPYGLIQQSKAPLRLIYQLSRLKFYPVVNTRYYQSWKDLDGANMFTHSRGSGTEAIMNLMASKHGIRYKSMTYLPGSSVRAAAMLQGRIRASIVDSERARLLMNEGGGKFALLPMPEIDASDEALYANIDFLEDRAREVDILLEELVRIWRDINRDPATILTLRDEFTLLPSLASDEVARILPYYEDGVTSKIFPGDGGGLRAAKADVEFYGNAGSIVGDTENLDADDFWYLAPLNRALETLGQK